MAADTPTEAETARKLNSAADVLCELGDLLEDVNAGLRVLLDPPRPAPREPRDRHLRLVESNDA
jgi:hypothetical protein